MSPPSDIQTGVYTGNSISFRKGPLITVVVRGRYAKLHRDETQSHVECGLCAQMSIATVPLAVIEVVAESVQAPFDDRG